MRTFAELWNSLAGAIKSSPRQPATAIAIPRSHIDDNRDGELESSFKKDQNYFGVVINEMYLATQRQWLATIDPVVYVVSEFTYNQQAQVVPFLLGPALLTKKGVPDQYGKKGMIFRNESVSGLHPYRGGGLTLTVVLCQAQTGNVARQLLKVLENATDALNFSPMLAPYMKVANVVIDGFDSLFSSGGVTPLAGLRDSFGPNFNIPFRPGYFTLVDSPNVDPATLWVQNRQLMQGSSWDNLQPYRSADFVLYSMMGPADNLRDDTDSLPFRDTWQQIWKLAGTGRAADWEDAKRQMAALNDSISFSPDLTETQAEKLADEYWNKLQAHHDKAQSRATMGDGGVQEGQERIDRIRSRSIAILNTKSKPAGAV
jgi:hypothetical protein